MTSTKQPLLRPASSYGRFIPREEMPEFATWTPGAFGQAPDARATTNASQAAKQAAAAAPVAPQPPTEAEWRARVQAAREQGWQDGFRDGQATLEALTQQLNAQLGARFGKMVADLDAQWDALEAGMAEAVTRTAVQLARQVVRTELATRPEIVAHVAQEAVGAVLVSARHLRLRIHPGDHGHVAAAAAETLQAREVRLVADPQVEPGGCVLESDLGRVDARIASRWATAAAVYGRDDAWDAEDTEDAEAFDASGAAGLDALPEIHAAPSMTTPSSEGLAP
jgi:flagellar assembly protein FliH